MPRRLLFLALLLLLPVLPAQAQEANIFIYHRFDESSYPSTNIAGDVFSRQLNYLHEEQIPVVPLSQVAAFLATGAALPEHAVALSVDDAYRSFADVAMPLIRHYGYPVTLFVNSDAVGTPGYLTWDELRQLSKEGVEIGNHSAAHPYMVERLSGESTAQWRERMRTDVLKAQTAFEEQLGCRPHLFAYPYGEYSNSVVELIRELGFVAAFGQQSGVVYHARQRYRAPRFPMGGPFATLSGFVDKVRMRPLPVIDQRPLSPLWQNNPPLLELRLEGPAVAANRFQCFVQGNNQCRVTAAGEGREGWYRITAEEPLTGRRNKYTLTLKTAKGDWLWFSQLWIQADNPHEEESY